MVNTNIDATDPVLLKERQRELQADIRQKEKFLERLAQEELEQEIQHRELEIEQTKVAPKKRRLKRYLKISLD